MNIDSKNDIILRASEKGYKLLESGPTRLWFEKKERNHQIEVIVFGSEQFPTFHVLATRNGQSRFLESKNLEDVKLIL